MNNNCPVKNIVFDIGMVLVDFRRHDYCRELGLDEDTTMRLIKGITEHPLWNELDRGAVEYEDINRAFLESEPDMQKQAELFWRDLTEIVRSFPQTKGWLADLRSRGYNIYLLSNYPKKMFELHCKTQFDFLEYVDGMVVSSYVGLVKPDRRIYELLLSKYNLVASQCVFLDDREENTEAAKRLGFKTVTVKDHVKAIGQLDELLSKYGERR